MAKKKDTKFNPLKTGILFLLIVAIVGSEIIFKAIPEEIQVPITKSLILRCSVNDSPSTPPTQSTGLVGRRSSPPRTAAGDDVIKHVTAITISRNDTPIASVTTYDAAWIESDADKSNVKVIGDVSGVSGELGYLELEWSFPSATQTGHYQCSVTGISASHHGISSTRDVDVNTVNIDTSDILTELRNLKKLALEHNKTITEMKIDHQESIKAQQQEIQKLTDAIVELRHLENGTLRCGASSSWGDGYTNTALGTRVGASKLISHTFKSRYSSPPIVFLSSSFVYASSKYEAPSHGTILTDVTSSGFQMRCFCHGLESDHGVTNYEVDWISFPL